MTDQQLSPGRFFSGLRSYLWDISSYCDLAMGLTIRCKQELSVYQFIDVCTVYVYMKLSGIEA